MTMPLEEIRKRVSEMDSETRQKLISETSLRPTWIHEFRHGKMPRPGASKVDELRAWLQKHQ